METITIGPPARCAGYHHLTGSYKDQCYNSWKYVPTIISDRDSDLIGVMIPQTQDVRGEKVQHKLSKRHRRFSGDELWKRVPNKGS